MSQSTLQFTDKFVLHTASPNK